MPAYEKMNDMNAAGCWRGVTFTKLDFKIIVGFHKGAPRSMGGIFKKVLKLVIGAVLSLEHTPSLLLRDARNSRRTHGGELDDHLSILRPDEVRCTLWLGKECARRVWRQLAFVPLLAQSKVVVA
jgi:hypothetical protein